MPVAILTPSPNPISTRAGAWTCSSLTETLDRIATIVRKYATLLEPLRPVVEIPVTT